MSISFVIIPERCIIQPNAIARNDAQPIPPIAPEIAAKVFSLNPAIMGSVINMEIIDIPTVMGKGG